MEQAPEIKPCPCCGSPAEEKTTIDCDYNKTENKPTTSHIECLGCGLRTKELEFSLNNDVLVQLIDLWNRRLGSDEKFAHEMKRVKDENTRLRYIVASSDLDCIYCKLPSGSHATCPFGGDCARTNDIVCGEQQ